MISIDATGLAWGYQSWVAPCTDGTSCRMHAGLPKKTRDRRAESGCVQPASMDSIANVMCSAAAPLACAQASTGVPFTFIPYPSPPPGLQVVQAPGAWLSLMRRSRREVVVGSSAFSFGPTYLVQCPPPPRQLDINDVCLSALLAADPFRRRKACEAALIVVTRRRTFEWVKVV